MKPAQGDQWPVGRFGHAACSLNCGEDHPTLILLVYGGQGESNKVLRDMWIFDVDSGKWREVGHSSVHVTLDF